MVKNYRFIILIYIMLSIILSYELSFASDTSEMSIIVFKVDSLPENATGEVKCSYLAGMAFLNKLDKYKLPEEINNYFTSSKVIIFESSNLSGSIDPDEIRSYMLTNFDIKKLFKPDIWTKLNEKCEKIGIKLEYMPFKPLIIAAMLLVKDMENAGKESYEKYIYDLAKEKAKSIKFLETSVSYLFDKIPLEAHVALVEKIVNDTGEIALESASLEKAYLSGDLDEIDRAAHTISSNKFIAEADKIWSRILIDERSNFWMPVIEDHILKGEAFIVVNIANLVGNNGIIEKLRKKGYRITNVSVISKKK